MQTFLCPGSNLHSFDFRISPTALNNEFFAKACQEWKDRLVEGKFSTAGLVSFMGSFLFCCCFHVVVFRFLSFKFYSLLHLVVTGQSES